MTDDALMHLTPRQYECLSLVAAHISPKQIARSLELSEHTVRGYLTEAIAVLGASDLRDAARIFSQSSNSSPLFRGGTIDREAEGARLKPLAPVFFTDMTKRVAEGAEREPYVDAGDTGPEPTTALERERKGWLLHLFSIHFFRRTRKANNLSVQQRATWIFIAVFIMMFLLAGSTLALELIIRLSNMSNSR